MKKIFLSIFIVIILVTIAVLLILNRKSISIYIDDYVARTEKNEVDLASTNNFKLTPFEPIEINTLKTDFVEFDLSNIPQIDKLVSEKTNYADDCGNGVIDNFKINIAKNGLKAKGKELSVNSYEILRIDNASEYLGKNNYYDEAYSEIQRTLSFDGDIEDEHFETYYYSSIHHLFFAGPVGQRIFYIRPVQTNNYDKVLVLYAYGSTQAVVNSNYLDFSIYILAKKDNNLYLSYFTNMLIQDFLKKNTLMNCETTHPDYGYELLNYFDNETNKCLIKEINENKNTQILEMFEKALLSKF